jgi:alanine racemase
MVRARRENFQEQGLTENTHFIASTGIGGSPADTKALVQLGTYALVGFAPEQQRYLYAKTHLNPTYEYGVTFERGTTISYGRLYKVEKPTRIWVLGIGYADGLFRALSNTYTGFPFLANLNLPGNVYNMMPYIVCLIVLAFTSKASHAPKAEGIPYDKGSR